MKKILIIVFVTTLFIAALLLLSGVMLQHQSAWSRLQNIEHSFWLIIWRYSVYLSVFLLWPYWVQRMGKKKQWSSAFVITLEKLRWRFILLVLLIEVFFVYNLLGHLIEWLGN